MMNSLRQPMLEPLDIPYPAHLVHGCRMANGRIVTIRPIRPDDSELEQEFVKSLSPRTRYYRFFNAIRELSPAMLDRFIRVDYRRQMTLVAVVREGGKEQQVGVAQYVAEPHADACEFAVVVHDDWQRGGLGSLLINSLMRSATDAGMLRIGGEVMADNQAMLELARKLGFSARTSRDDATLMTVSKTLSTATIPVPAMRQDFDQLAPCAA